MRVSRRASIDRYYLLSFRGYGLFLHRLKQSDPEDTLHTHPWNGASLILGAYKEFRLGSQPAWRVGFNFVRAKVPHRVELPFPLWTLFLHGPRSNTWGVYELDGTLIELEPWRGVGGRDTYRRA